MRKASNGIEESSYRWIKKKVIAFVNTQGGKILIGIDDEGTVVGLTNSANDLESISSMLRDGIRPEVLVTWFGVFILGNP
ncbi:ATP-binding protein [Paenisporosarcina sp. TG20]|uniref:AlbA family DNA-binding domain-containing protein n=1 Tax=Paenisporosarcina sp. TG20 TaxID=1211706 RepID=UPI000A042579